MNWYRSADGEQRIWFKPDEIEDIMTDELRKAELLPSTADPVVALEAFVEGHLHAALDQYADLDEDVLGLTEFAPGARPLIKINRNLTVAAVDQSESEGLFGRWRATVAHEGSHVVLHRLLFELNEDQVSLFPAEHADRPRLLRCLKREVSFSGRSGDWREVQANRGMAALLMPRQVFTAMAAEEMASMGVTDVESASDAARMLASRVARRCAVSREAASIRLETLGCLRIPGHRPLPI